VYLDQVVVGVVAPDLAEELGTKTSQGLNNP
jgi:hypothetical protein